MVHAHAAPRPAGFVLHAPAARPDVTRILTLSSTLAFNLLVFGLLMLPMSVPLPDTSPPARNPEVRQIPRPPQVVEIVTQPLPPRPPQASTPAVPHPPVAPVTATRTEATTATTSTTAVETHSDTVIPTTDLTPPGNPAPTPMQLAYRAAPAPAYPRAALQRGLTGTVLLQVLVDENGHPLDVRVARSSGYRELDEAARLQVLKRWSFQPATEAGRAVQAIGLVPIEFNLRH